MNGDVCEDENECDNDPCGDNAQCENKPGFYQCTCDEGFVRQNAACIGEFSSLKR